MSLYPGVPRRWLFVIGGTTWMLVGLMLCGRAIGWMLSLGTLAIWLLVTISLIAGIVLYTVAFVRVVRKNVKRIDNLPDRACAFAFTAWHGYGMIAVMITLGIELRTSPLPKIYLILPYLIMGLQLLIGSVQYFKVIRERYHTGSKISIPK